MLGLLSLDSDPETGWSGRRMAWNYQSKEGTSSWKEMMLHSPLCIASCPAPWWAVLHERRRGRGQSATQKSCHYKNSPRHQSQESSGDLPNP